MKRHNSSGFTLVEIAVAVAIMGIIGMISYSVALIYNVRSGKLHSRTSETIDVEVAQQMLWIDLQTAGPSFNNINLRDNNNRPFFDYLPDYPQSLLSEADNKRELTLTPNGTNKTFYLLLADRLREPIIQYDPVAAYNLTFDKKLTMNGTLVFVSLNQNNYVEKLNKKLWESGVLIMLYSPAYLRPENAPMTTVPRYPTFIGAVKGANAVPLPSTAVPLNQAHPVNGIMISSPDVLFRNLVPIGGTAAVVFMSAIKLVKYSFAKTDKGYNLIRETWNGDNEAYENRVIIAPNVEELVLKRNTITTPSIEFDLKLVDREELLQQ